MAELKSMKGEEGKYTFLKWNGSYGSEANFVVRENATGKQSYFTPDNVKDVAFVDADLTKDPLVKSWDTFGNETIDDLNDVVF